MTLLNVDQFFALNPTAQEAIKSWLRLHDINPDLTYEVEWDDATIIARQFVRDRNGRVKVGLKGDLRRTEIQRAQRAPAP